MITILMTIMISISIFSFAIMVSGALGIFSCRVGGSGADNLGFRDVSPGAQALQGRAFVGHPSMKPEPREPSTP